MPHDRHGRFPVFAFALLFVGIVWLLQALGILQGSFPWVPVLVIVIALGMLVRFYHK